jgi:hypothetical protein
MIKRLLLGLCCTLPIMNAQAAEITVCIIDTSIESNKVFYYFPLSRTLLRCDHLGENKPVSLNELYALNWRLIHMESPVRVDQGENKSAYTPPLLYLERTHAPGITKAPEENDSDKLATPEESTSESSTGGLFKWFGSDNPNPEDSTSQ